MTVNAYPRDTREWNESVILAAMEWASQEALRGVLHESLNLKYYHAHNGVQALREWIKDRLAREGVRG